MQVTSFESGEPPQKNLLKLKQDSTKNQPSFLNNSISYKQQKAKKEPAPLAKNQPHNRSKSSAVHL